MNKQKVGDSEYLYRRSFNDPLKKYCNPDGTATSRVFKLRPKDENQLSVNVKSLTTIAQSVQDTSKYILFEISHLSVQQCGVNAYSDPDQGNLAHAFIWGDNFDLDNDVIPGLLARRATIISS
jgi:hypothetical protein